jgi:hypothetical protein
MLHLIAEGLLDVREADEHATLATVSTDMMRTPQRRVSRLGQDTTGSTGSAYAKLPLVETGRSIYSALADWMRQTSRRYRSSHSYNARMSAVQRARSAVRRERPRCSSADLRAVAVPLE